MAGPALGRPGLPTLGRGAYVHPGLIRLGSLAAAAFMGLLLAVSVPKGIGFLLGVVYVPLVLIDFPIGLSVWVGILFVQHVPAASVGPNAAGLIVALGWLGTLGSRRADIREVLSQHRRLTGIAVLFFIWMALSPAFSTVPSQSYDDVGLWFKAMLTLLVIATTVVTRRHLRMILYAFTIGGALSVAVGIPSGGLTAAPTAADSATVSDGRFQGGGGDPNFLAAGLVPAIALALVLIAQVRDPIMRWGLTCAVGLMGIGLAASESRGGLIAAVVATVVALLIARRKTAAVAAVAVVAIMAGAYFAASPGALSRTTDFQGGGTGRTELWTIALKIWEQHPVTGTGLDSFRYESYQYVRQLNNLKYVRLIAERPDHVHNSYLEVLAETGIVGLGLMLSLIAGCLRAMWMAMRRFDALGEKQLASTARAVLAATVGTLVAAFFLSASTGLLVWAILGLGPALLAISRRVSNERPLQTPAAP